MGQAVVGSAMIYLLIIVNRFMQAVVEKDDPFANAHLISMLIFFNVIQRLIFTIAMIIYLKVDVKTTFANP